MARDMQKAIRFLFWNQINLGKSLPFWKILFSPPLPRSKEGKYYREIWFIQSVPSHPMIFVACTAQKAMKNNCSPPSRTRLQLHRYLNIHVTSWKYIFYASNDTHKLLFCNQHLCPCYTGVKEEKEKIITATTINSEARKRRK